MVTLDEQNYLGNFILDSLPQQEYDLLYPQLNRLELQQGDIVARAQEPISQVYFPTTALLAWTHSTTSGETVQVGITGFEGVMGIALLLNQNTSPWQVKVRLTGEAFALSATFFVSALRQSPVLQQKVSGFTEQAILQLGQSAVCNRTHQVEQRLCRSLLTMQDRVQTAELRLTRDAIAEMLGVPRSGTSLPIATLQAMGLIHVAAESVTILDRAQMETAACECCYILREAFDRYLQR